MSWKIQILFLTKCEAFEELKLFVIENPAYLNYDKKILFHKYFIHTYQLATNLLCNYSTNYDSIFLRKHYQ